MMRPLIPWTLGGVLLATALGASAGHPGGPHQGRHGIDLDEMAGHAEERFTRADANGDGQVTFDEFAAAHEGRGLRGPHHGKRRGHGPRMGGFMPPDSDPETMERRHEHMGEHIGERMRERRAELEPDLFAALDANGDGMLSPEEFAGRHDAMRTVAQRRAFERLDADGDGVLSAAEMSGGALDRLRRLDSDGDGTVTRREMRAGARARLDAEPPGDAGAR